MRREVIGNCPICKNQLHVTELKCNSCHTQLVGEFQLCKFCNLSQEDKDFIEVFLLNRGNIKEIEKDLGISYPTVRGKLDNVIQALGYNPEPEKLKIKIDKKSILKQLDDGEISSEEAISLLKGE